MKARIKRNLLSFPLSLNEVRNGVMKEKKGVKEVKRTKGDVMNDGDSRRDIP